jgi:hypothetical protein
MSENPNRRAVIRGLVGVAASAFSLPIEAQTPTYIEPLILHIMNRERILSGHAGKDMVDNAFKAVGDSNRIVRFETAVNIFTPTHIPQITWQELKRILIGLPSQESRFDPQKKNKGSAATGLCQITTSALTDLTREFDLPQLKIEQMTDATIATQTMLHIFDKSLYTRLHKPTTTLSTAFNLSEQQAAVFQALILMNGYNVGPTIMNDILRKFVNELQTSTNTVYLKEVMAVLDSNSGFNLFDLIRTRAYEQKYSAYFKEEAYLYVAYVLAAANVLNNYKNRLSSQNAS